jgi:hypothetical protein
MQIIINSNTSGVVQAEIRLSLTQTINVTAFEQSDYHSDSIISQPVAMPYEDFYVLSCLPVGQHAVELTAEYQRRLKLSANH